MIDIDTTTLGELDSYLVPYTIYDPLTGQISQSGTEDARFVRLRMEQNQHVLILQSNAHTDYVDLATLTVRPMREMTITQSGSVFTGLPPNTDVKVLQNIFADKHVVIDEFVVDDGELDLHMSYPGTYQVKMNAPTYLEYTSEYTQ